MVPMNKCNAITRLIPNGSGKRRLNHAGGYHNVDNGLAANGYPPNIDRDQSGIPCPVARERWIRNRFGKWLIMISEIFVPAGTMKLFQAASTGKHGRTSSHKE
jgi:hypothetical protein